MADNADSAGLGASSNVNSARFSAAVQVTTILPRVACANVDLLCCNTGNADCAVYSFIAPSFVILNLHASTYVRVSFF